MSSFALVTGASRGVGAMVARLLAQRGMDIAINYRNKVSRAEAVASEIIMLGRKAMPIGADLTQEAERNRIAEHIAASGNNLDLLVLNASGGLERDKPPSYPMDINCIAQIETVRLLQPLMSHGSTIIFVTSHWSHFYGEHPVISAYRTVAQSKKAGEVAVRAKQDTLWDSGIRLLVVSGDIVEGTATPKLLDRAHPGLIKYRRELVGKLPTLEDFATAIVEAAFSPVLASGTTVFVGSTDLRIPFHMSVAV